MNLGSSSDVCWHSSRELYRFHCCHWGCWEPVSLCLGFRFALLPPSASFPWQGTALHILPISLSSTLLNHIGSVRHQFVVDPSPTHPLFCGGLPHNFMRFCPLLFFSSGIFLIVFWIREFELPPCPTFSLPGHSLSNQRVTPSLRLYLRSSNKHYSPRVNKVFPSFHFNFFE